MGMFGSSCFSSSPISIILHFSLFLLALAYTTTCKLLLPKYFYHKRSCLPLPPGPKPWPIVGCLPQVFRHKPVFRWIHKHMEDDLNTNIACFRLGNVHVIPVTCPEIAREFLKKNDRVFASRPSNIMSAHLISGGYLTTGLVPFGEQWKKMRKVISNEFLSAARHCWLHEKRKEEADHLVRWVYSQCGGRKQGGLVNVRLVAQHYTANLIRKMMFGKRFFGKGMEDGGPGAEELEHIHSGLTLVFYLNPFCVSDYLPSLRWIVDLCGDHDQKVVREALESVRKYQDPEVDERIRKWKDGTKTVEEDLLDVLINLEQPSLSAEEIKAQFVELFIAAIDNAPNAVEWALAEMLKQPKLLQSATEELDRVVGRNRLVQEHDLSKLNYIKACIKEALRLHPLLPFNAPHVSMSDVNVAGYFIPKGSHVLLSKWGLGRNPSVWEEPLVFNPERHLQKDHGAEVNEVVLMDHELNMITFSTGRRMCPGVTLGSAMIGILFARILQGFTWQIPPDQPAIDLTESQDNLFMAKPLIAYAEPRLAEHLYSCATTRRKDKERII